MTYSTELAKISRTKVGLLILTMDYCDETYGTSPCTATDSVKCYNTFATCKDKTNYDKTTIDYEFIDADLPISIQKEFYPAKPFMVGVNDLPTEIKEDNTVTKRLVVELLDNTDNDVGIDPYRADRTEIKGSFWKKFLARNPNYKDRIITYKEGFSGLTTANFETKFVGRIENIKLTETGVTIEAVDLLKKLSEIEYPLKTDVYLNSDLPMMFEAASEDNMLALNAQTLDYCTRSDFKAISGVSDSVGSGALEQGTWAVVIVAYDSADKPFAKYEGTVFLGSPLDDGSIELSWSAVTNASYYYVHYRLNPSGTWQRHVGPVIGTSVSIISPTGWGQLEAPEFAELVYYLSGDDPSDIADWTEIHGGLTITLSAAVNSDTSGYLKVDKEVIYFASRTSAIYGGIERAQGGSDAARHDANTRVELLLQESPDDGFTRLKNLLSLGGIDAAYIDTKFTTYETTGSTIEHSTNVIFKKTKLSEIYFDLVNALDCISWVGEDGKIKILKHSEIPSTIPQLTDEANIVEGSDSVDLNEGSRYTRWLIYWNRWDVEKGLKDKEAYNRLTMLIDSVAESDDEYGDEIENIMYTTWINTDSDTSSNITTYLAALLASRKSRMRDARPFFMCATELKDAEILTGDIVLISTDKLQDKDGNDYENVAFRLIKKAPRGNRIEMKFKKYISEEGTLLLESGDTLLLESGDNIKTKIL